MAACQSTRCSSKSSQSSWNLLLPNSFTSSPLVPSVAGRVSRWTPLIYRSSCPISLRHLFVIRRSFAARLESHVDTCHALCPCTELLLLPLSPCFLSGKVSDGRVDGLIVWRGWNCLDFSYGLLCRLCLCLFFETRLWCRMNPTTSF